MEIAKPFHLEKRCRVCGDVAKSFNCNGLSCESCKSFFRRNAFLIETFHCERKRNCEISVQTRNACKRCRLDKCVAVGMERKLLNARCKRNKNIDPNDMPIDLTKQLSTIHTQESVRLMELGKATQHFSDERKIELSGEAEDMLQVVALSAHNIREVLTFAQNLSSFVCLQLEDQLVMLRNFYVSKLLVGIAFFYCPAKNGFLCMRDESCREAVLVRMNVLYKFSLQEGMFPKYKEFHQFICALNAEMENDSIIRDLILAQVLFKNFANNRDNSPEIVSYHRNVYQYLMKQYLIHKYRNNHEQALDKLCALNGLMDQIEEMGKITRQVVGNVAKSTQLGGVLVEIYDL